MLPASKVSVPLTVVMRRRSRVPERVIVPAVDINAAPSDLARVPAATQVFPVTILITTVPWTTAAADPVLIPKPLVNNVAVNPGPSVDDPKYPLVVKLVEPIWTKRLLVPLVLTPLNIIVMRFTQDGMPVKSMLVPLVLACEVPEVITLLAIDDTEAPVITGLVSVLLVSV